jgi:hypothetical protein
MPVIDTPVHPHGVRGADHRYGCHSHKPFNTWYLARDGWKMNRSCEGESPEWVTVQHTMSRDCRYDQRSADSRCAECQVPSDWEYLKRMGL